MTLGELTSGVSEIIKAKIYAGETAERDWIVQEFSQQLGDDEEAWKTLGREELKDMVERIIRRHKVVEPKPRAGQIEMTAPGYEYVQLGYSIERDGKAMYVPLKDMTDDEVRRKRDEHFAAGAGHNAHGRELDDVLRNRANAVAAA